MNSSFYLALLLVNLDVLEGRVQDCRGIMVDVGGQQTTGYTLSQALQEYWREHEQSRR